MPNPRSDTPIELPGSAGNGPFALGLAHACGAGSDGKKIACWGENRYGQLGDGTFEDRVTPTVLGQGPGTVLSLSAGAQHTCVVASGGAVFCFGRNDHGQLGDGTSLSEPRPVTVMLPCPVP